MNKVLFTLILCAIVLFGKAQESKTGNWIAYFGNQKIGSKLNWHNEVQLRNYNLIGDLQQVVLRTGIGYNLTENNNNILVGYGFIHSQNYNSSSTQKIIVNEHRIFQQFITKQSFNRITLQHRYRLEERFISKNFQMRFRYFLGLNIALNKKTIEKNTAYVSLYNEIFLNAQNNIFDRNRLYGGLGYAFNKNLKVELALMNQKLEKTNRNQFQIVLFNNLPFNK